MRREVKNGMVSPYAYLLANVVIQIPMMFIMSVFALSVSGFGVGLFNVRTRQRMIAASRLLANPLPLRAGQPVCSTI